MAPQFLSKYLPRLSNASSASSDAASISSDDSSVNGAASLTTTTRFSVKALKRKLKAKNANEAAERCVAFLAIANQIMHLSDLCLEPLSNLSQLLHFLFAVINGVLKYTPAQGDHGGKSSIPRRAQVVGSSYY
jgi:hypothetical protein